MNIYKNHDENNEVDSDKNNDENNDGKKWQEIKKHEANCDENEEKKGRKNRF